MVFSTREIWVQVGFSVLVNWIVAPLLMVISPLSISLTNPIIIIPLLLIVSFNPHTNSDWQLTKLGLAWAFLPDQSALRNGLILVGLARCIAMVLIWVSLAGGDSEYCAILVAINSFLQMLLFAPLALLFTNIIGGSDGDQSVDYATIAKSVGVFLGIPLGAAILTGFW